MKAGNIIAFISGAAIGSVVTWKIIKDKYAALADAEIESVKERLIKSCDDFEEIYDEVDDEFFDEGSDQVDAKTNEEIIKEQGYVSDDSEPKKARIIQHSENNDEPFVISPDNFGDNEDYEQISLTYYEGDGFLVDDSDSPIEDIEDMVGFECLEQFGKYEEDVVHVQNDKYKTYYEICTFDGKWRDVVRP